MKATLKNSFAKRSIVIAATALPSFYAAVAGAQAAPPPPVAPPPPAAVEPAPPPPPQDTGTLPAAPPTIAPPEANPVAPLPAPPVTPPPAPTDPDAEKYKHIDIGVWMRLTTKLQKRSDPSKLGGVGGDGEVELHMANQMRKYLAWTANLVGTYGPGTGDGSGTISVLDLIAQFEPDPLFNVWVGRMLVPTDRSNFSGPYFMGPWNYQVFNPKEGPFGRNNGVTVWGQVNGGLLKYYAGAFNLNDPDAKVLFSGRLNLALLSPEPGFYSSSTYYGKDLLGIGIGAQYQKNGDAGVSADPAIPPPRADYGLFNADVLFEKDLAGSGVVDVEGAFYKYFGDLNPMKYSYYALASYLTPKIEGVGMFQPLVRVEQGKAKAEAIDTATIIDAQVGYVVDSYATRFALGFQHASAGQGVVKSNAIFAGIQLQK